MLKTKSATTTTTTEHTAPQILDADCRRITRSKLRTIHSSSSISTTQATDSPQANNRLDMLLAAAASSFLDSAALETPNFELPKNPRKKVRMIGSDESSEHIVKLYDDIEKLKNINAKLRNQDEKIKASCNRLNSGLIESTQNILKLKEELNAEQRSNNSLRCQKAELFAVNADLKRIVAEHKTGIESLKQENSSLLRISAEGRELLKRKQYIIDYIKAMEASGVDKDQKIDLATKKIEALEAEITKTSNQLKTQSQELSGLQQTETKSQLELQELREQLEQLEQYKNIYFKLINEKDQHREQIAKLLETVGQEQQQKESQEQIIQGLEAELAKSRSQYVELLSTMTLPPSAMLFSSAHTQVTNNFTLVQPPLEPANNNWQPNANRQI